MIQRPLTPAELAERWSCTDQHVYNLVRRGELPAVRHRQRNLVLKGNAR